MARCNGRIIIKGLLLAACLFPALTATAQDEPEYRMEVGAGAGLITYTGDFNGNILKGMQPWGTLVARYHLNPRMALAMNIGTGKIKGSTDDLETWSPIERYEFDNQITEADFRYEYNFWAYGTGQEYRGARRLVPFITLGLGLTHHSGDNSGITVNLPLGVGIKWKAANRLNLTVEWAMRFTPNDNLDGRKDIYGIKSSGLFKNTDCYSVLQVGLSYDLWAKCKTCNNDRD
ncbi:MAG: outer membrane beta-barrel protein [Prevotella sp.]|nr:outer membrane beta-barrel protein [Prevotella sp.]